MNWDELPELLSTTSVARIFDMKVATIRDWIRAGKFPNAVRISGVGTQNCWRIPKDDVRALAKTRVG